jgi:ketosteroid isomerase-like protein
VTREELSRWVVAYEAAWRAPGTDAVADLFTPEATYSMAPFEEPHAGLDAIKELWDHERPEGEQFTIHWQIVAVESDTGVVRLEVEYTAPEHRIFRDLWIVALDDAGRCTAFEEWPFSPE